VESGLAHTMDQYDKNFKVRRLMGDDVSKIKRSSTADIQTTMSTADYSVFLEALSDMNE
jgi:hypothetical protein